MAQQIVIEVPGTKISELERTSSVSRTDVTPVVQNDETKQAEIGQIADFVKSELGSAALKNESDFATPASVASASQASQARDDAQNERIDNVEFGLFSIANGADKSFATYAEMIGYVPTEANVSVRNNDPNPDLRGTYIWDGSNYTRSYDALDLSKDYINLKTSPLFSSLIASLNTLDKTITSDANLTLREVSKMLIKSVKNTSETNKLTVAIDNNSENSASIVLLPNESVSNNVQTDLWSKLSMNSADFTKVVVASTNGWRIQYQYYAYAFDKAVDQYNVFDKNAIFESRTQNNLETASNIAISSHGGGYLQFYVPTSVLTSAGLPNNAEAADGYLILRIAQSDIFAIQRNSTLTKNIDEILLNKGSLVVDFTGNHTSTLETYVLEKPKVLDVTNLDFKQYIADVKNSTGVALTNQPIELKVNFNYGEVASNEHLIVLDESGNEYECQFGDEYHVNHRFDKSTGFYADGSLRSGTIVIYDSLAINEKKSYVVRAYQQVVRDSIKPELVFDSVNNRYSIDFDGFTYYFTKDNSYYLKSIVNGSTTHNIKYSTRIRAFDLSSYVFLGDSSIKLVSSGDNFVEVETVVYNQAVSTLAANQLKARTRTKIFKAGKVKIETAIICQNLIDGTAICGLMGEIYNSDVTSNAGSTNPVTASLSDFYRTLTYSKNGKVNILPLYYHGDNNRGDTVAYGPIRDMYLGQVLTTSYYQCRIGFTQEPTSDSANMWDYEKNWAFVHGFLIDLKSNLTDPKSICDRAYNQVTGFLGTGQRIAVTRRAILSRMAEYVSGADEWWEDFYAPASNDTLKMYAAKIVSALAFNSGSIDEIYTQFIASTSERFGTNLGTAWKNGTFSLSFGTRNTIPPLQWLYFYYLKNGDTVKVDALKALIQPLATEFVIYYNSKGGIGNVGSGSDVGAGNIILAGYRVLALAYKMGLDTDNSIKTVIDNLLTNVHSNYQICKNYVNDAKSARYTQTIWLHYHAFAIYSYVIGNKLMNYENSIDVQSWLLANINGNGMPKDMQANQAESRRGGRNTLAFMTAPFLFTKSNSGINAVSEMFKQLDLEEKGEVSNVPIFGFKRFTQESVDSDTVMTAEAFADIWLNFYFEQATY
ncbi:hypothetical protein [Acinetobacter sp. 1264765]|uniref:hypothetical protein n=1 Tax=Acinetobacter sp. 1264765 TaxID=1310824 RepID=UPI000460A5E7|nr:hypothetical protein [Acinetobacter sp. 1264765]KCX18062.1 hypothetical protein J723_0309 [Acinetobacter sp. 1264765]